MLWMYLFACAGTAASQPHPADRDLRPLGGVEPSAESALLRPVTIRQDGMRFDDALHEVARQAGLRIVFGTDIARDQGASDVELVALPAGEALLRLIEATELTAFVAGSDGVVIVPRSGAEPAQTLFDSVLRSQTIRGRVVDRTTRAPLIGANVVVMETDPLIGSSTDGDGRFAISQVPLGRQSVRVSYTGYTPVVLPDVMVTAAKEVILHVELEERVVQGIDIVVVPEIQKDQPLNEMALVSARSFSVEETRRYAGGLDDPARMASSFAGVATGAGIQENAVVVRGNAPKGILWRLEGVEIPNPNHFAGLAVMGAGGLTLFSSHLLADADFLTSAFPAEYGNALGGVFDMRFRSGNASSREHAVQLGLIGIDAASEGPFVVGKPSTYLFNYRYSTIGLLMPLLPTEDVARFQDLSFKLHFPARAAGVFEVWGIGGLDGQSMTASDDPSEWEYEEWDRLESDLRLGLGAAGVAHTLLLSRRAYLRSSLAGTVNRTVIDQQRMSDELLLVDDLSARSTSSHLIFSSYVNHRISSRLVQRTGLSIDRMIYDVALRSVIEESGAFVPVVLERGRSTLLRAYTQAQTTLGPALTLQTGMHGQHFALTGRTAIEPRFGLRWSVEEGHTVTAGYGLHSQTEDVRMYLARVGSRMPNLTLDFAKAHHGVLGYERTLTAASRLKLEAYVQRLFDVPVISDSSYSLLNFTQDWAFAQELVNRGAGRNVGLEASFERFLQDGYYVLITGSAYRSTYRGGDDLWRPTRWSRGATLDALAGREFQLGDNIFGANIRLAAMGGLRRSPVDLPASRQAREVVLDETRAFSAREPGLFLLDVTLTYRRNHRSVSQVWALQVKNALAATETVLRYNERRERVDEVKEGFPLPVLSYKLEF
jgi:hypothetical protein